MLKQKIASTVLITCTVLMLVGCGKNQKMEEETNVYSIGMDGNRFYYDTSDEEVISITETVQGYCETFIAVDYNNQSLELENSYYSKERYELYQSLSRDEIIYNRNNERQRIEKFVSSQVENIVFYKMHGAKFAKVNINTISVMEHGTDEWLTSINVIPGKQYERTFTITLIYENDNWKVSEFTNTDYQLVTE